MKFSFTLFSSILAASLLLATSAQAAQKKAIDARRTLFVPVAQMILTLEAPKNMCFVDQTSPTENALFKSFATKDGQVLLAVFADCNSLMNAGTLSGANSPQYNAGTISWMNPLIGETTSLNRTDYLDMREASFQQYALNDIAGFQPDQMVHRTENNVSLGLSGELDVNFQKFKSTVVLSTTSIRNIPLQVMFRTSGEKMMQLENIYPLMDKFITQQITLNE